MEFYSSRMPRLDRYYREYLRTENTARFIRETSRNYTLGSLMRLSSFGRRISRRAAVLALGLIGDMGANHCLGRALHDRDRAVRMLAENGIRAIWMRDGNAKQRQELQVISRLNLGRQFESSMPLASDLIKSAPGIAESWNQRAMAHYGLERIEESINDCCQALELNPYHFAAAVGMAHGYLELGDAFAALESFRRALQVNPGLDQVRIQIELLQRSLEGK